MAESPSNRADTVDDEPSLSIVIPAYNESSRIDTCLEKVLAYAAERPCSTEVVLVDDGSSDDTLARARSFVTTSPRLRILAEPHRGKAAAVEAGILAATGRIILFMDADLATPLSHTEDLVRRIEAGADVAIGSREGAGARRVGEPLHRHLMGRIFNLIVQVLLLPGIEDTQCGFKAFRRDATRQILRATLLYRGSGPVHGARVTAFDVELLYIARLLGQTVAVVPVVWSAGTGSKVNPIHDTWVNLTDVVKIRINGWRGRYRNDEPLPRPASGR